MKKLVSENLGNILRPKSSEDVTSEIKELLVGKDINIIKENDMFVIYQVKKWADIKQIIRNLGGRDEDVFYNFYLILDNSVVGNKQVIGIKVSPDGTINALDAKGSTVNTDYLTKFED